MPSVGPFTHAGPAQNERPEVSSQPSRSARRRDGENVSGSRRQSKESEWWSVLEVSPHATADEIRRSYLSKIKETHPDRVVWLAPKLLPLAEVRAKSLNVAYAEAIRARGKSGRAAGTNGRCADGP